jgi:hypothetical protein
MFIVAATQNLTVHSKGRVMLVLKGDLKSVSWKETVKTAGIGAIEIGYVLSHL